MIKLWNPFLMISEMPKSPKGDANTNELFGSGKCNGNWLRTVTNDVASVCFSHCVINSRRYLIPDYTKSIPPSLERNWIPVCISSIKKNRTESIIISAAPPSSSSVQPLLASSRATRPPVTSGLFGRPYRIVDYLLLAGLVWEKNTIPDWKFTIVYEANRLNKRTSLQNTH